MEALGVEPVEENNENNTDRVLERFGANPENVGLWERITSLNDKGSTREEIADLLASEGL